MRTFFMVLFCVVASVIAQAQDRPQSDIIPQPQELHFLPSTFALPKDITYTLSVDKGTAQILPSLLTEYIGNKYKLKQKRKEGILLLKYNDTIENEEGYELRISAKQIVIEARSVQGFRYALETLRQLRGDNNTYPQCVVKDRPRFSYRGVMLDVSRHFFPIGYIKSLINEMARLKFNRFHWHLVDGGGWRMESKYYPLLTQKAAYRTEQDWDKWWHNKDRRFTTAEEGYGGFYTQEEIKEVVQYAMNLGITIIPEIEMPGHSNELIYAYPDLLCPSATHNNATDVCIGNEEVFTFFERILDETMALFPGKYIHIGGDEAAMNHWGNCPRCKQRMKEENLKDLHELQSYMIKRIERYLNSKGRKLIGWDEILMGGLAPDATVMSWRGENGGITASQAGHDVIMTPNNNLYIDYYQNEATDEPRAIGGYVPLEKVYNYNPIPQSLNESEKKHIIGVQANLWTEYIHTPEHASYMLFPRILALAEIAWTAHERKDYNDFRRRATHYLPQLEERGHKPYQMNGITLHQSYDSVQKAVALKFQPERSDAVIRIAEGYSPTVLDKAIDTQTPYIYKGKSPRDIHVNLFANGKKLLPNDRIYRTPAHLAIGAKITYHCKWNERYPAGGENSLIDGLYGTPTYLDGRWQGFTEPMDMTITLAQEHKLQGIELRFMAEREQWVYMPKTVEVQISKDGTNYESIGILEPKTSDKNPRPVFETFTFSTDKEARYIRIKAKIGRSEGHFIFCDEVAVY